MRNYVQYSEVLNTSNKTGVKTSLLQGKAEYAYDSSSKAYLLKLNTGSVTIPRSAKDKLELVRPYLLCQVFIYPGKLLTIELTTTDSDSIKRRLIFTQGKQVIKNAMHARLPNTNFYRNTWVNLSFDVNSIFNLCFPGKLFRSLDMIFITGTLKIKKILSLMLPFSELLPIIGDMPKYPISLQELDSLSFPQPRPLYFSDSPAKVNKKHYYRPSENLFYKPTENANELKTFKSQYMKSINMGAKVLFRTPKPKPTIERDYYRKITHNHSKNLIEYEEQIEENIEENLEESSEKKSWGELITSNVPSKPFDVPDYYQTKILQLCQIRHFTPPFVNSKENLVYNPVDRHYDNLQ
jgi:Protein of unknown function (DUF667)